MTIKNYSFLAFNNYILADKVLGKIVHTYLILFPTLNSTTDSTRVDNNDVSLTLHLTKLQKKISILPTKPIFYYDDLKTFSFLSQQTPSQIKD